MAIIEIDRTLTATSTGATERLDGRTVREWTVYVDCPAGSTGSYALQTARNLDSTTPAIAVSSAASSGTLGAGEGQYLQFTGPAVLFARVKSLTASTGTMHFRFLGN